MLLELLALTTGLLAVDAPAATGDAVVTLSFEGSGADVGGGWTWKADSVAATTFTPGALASPTRPNAASATFDGSGAIGYLIPPRAAATSAANDVDDAPLAAPFSGEFTWEGFFFADADSSYETDAAIAHRLLTQFRDDKGSSTRLTVGLSATKAGAAPLLSVALVGTSTRHIGRTKVEPGTWHHFAVVVHQQADGRRLDWYLDYQLEGEVTLAGAGPRDTLEAPGWAPLAVGARLKQAGKVDRGFNGLIDELRLVERALSVDEFQRATPTSYPRVVEVRYFDRCSPELLWQPAKLAASETLAHEALSLVGMPQAFSHAGYPAARQGWQMIQAASPTTLPEGRYRLLLRTNVDALLRCAGHTLIDARIPTSEHPLGKPAVAEGVRDYFAEIESDGTPRDFELLTAYNANSAGTVPEVVVAVAPVDASQAADSWHLLGAGEPIPLSRESWAAYGSRARAWWQSQDEHRRAAALAGGRQFWQARHRWARQQLAAWPQVHVPEGAHPIDTLLAAKMEALGIEPGPSVDDAAFLRRVTLDLAGRIPTLDEVCNFLADTAAEKRQRVIDRLLASDEWADAWIPYWQDVLAENPSILKPALNNTGAFRTFLHRAHTENLPLDRFVAELLAMEGPDDAGGTAGFAMAAMNDVPMAMKAHVVAKAFLGLDLNCARCHDSPVADFQHSDLFHLAAMLAEKPITIPASSTVVVPPGGRIPAVTSDLTAGQKIQPKWPLSELVPDAGVAPPAAAALADRPRMKLAEVLTTPTHTRFTDVMVNRVWQRFFGAALIEPVDNWEDRSDASHPELLDYLSRWLVEHDYDLKALTRLLLTSDAYGRQVAAAEGKPLRAAERTFAWQSQRRMSAEQLVDSLHQVVGKPFRAEELSFDPNRTRGFLNLPAPRRSWQLASLANERDRPALSLPVNMMIIDVLQTFGWRESRADPITQRDELPNPLQPLMLANGLMAHHLVRLTEDNVVTEWCLETDLSPASLAERLFLSVLGRNPSQRERQLIVELVEVGFDARTTGLPKPAPVERRRAVVDWDKHLDAAASVELLEYEERVREGDPPTVRLTEDFRQRVEDALWCLLNSPEFVFVP